MSLTSNLQIRLAADGSLLHLLFSQKLIDTLIWVTSVELYYCGNIKCQEQKALPSLEFASGHVAVWVSVSQDIPLLNLSFLQNPVFRKSESSELMFNTVKLDNFKKHQHVTINLSVVESQVPGELKLGGQPGLILVYWAKLGKISEGNFTVNQMALNKFSLC